MKSRREFDARLAAITERKAREARRETRAAVKAQRRRPSVPASAPT